MWTENGRISRTLSQSLVFKDMEPEKELKLLDVVREFQEKGVKSLLLTIPIDDLSIQQSVPSI